jgi:hypothetical protein
MFTISFETAIVKTCDYIGRTTWGVRAIVLKGGIEVFRSQPKAKRFACRREAETWIKEQAA